MSLKPSNPIGPHSSRVVLTGMAAGLLVMAGCRSAAQTGVAVGVLAGAGLGQVIGASTGATILGAAIGGAAGYMIGNEEDKSRAPTEPVHMRQEMDYVTVNISNSNGSMSLVRLQRRGIGYVGARGEYYDHLPSEDELRPVYGF